MDIGHIISIVSIVVSVLLIVISGLIGLVLKGNSTERKTLEDSLATETKDRKKDIEKMETQIKDEAETLHVRCNSLEKEAKEDREKSHKTELKILSELSEIKVLIQANN